VASRAPAATLALTLSHPPPTKTTPPPPPGRVNLIGEHIDYEGYGVLPMAIAADTVVAIRAVPAAAAAAATDPPSLSSSSAPAAAPTLRLANLDSAAYPPAVFSADPDQTVDVANHSWGNYFLAAYKGVHDFLRERAAGGGAATTTTTTTTVPSPLPSLEVLVHGTVPLGSGLSSSAALVCSASLAILAAYGKIPPPARGAFAWAQAAAGALLGAASASAWSSSAAAVTKGAVADFSCKAERYVGVNGGGMDQAISVMARRGVAMLVDFDPVRAAEVPLPADAVFVVGHSLAVSKKAETADKRYNLRVVECRLAAALLAKRLGGTTDEAASVRTLRDVEARVAAKGAELMAAAEAEAARKQQQQKDKKDKNKKGTNKDDAVVAAAVDAANGATTTTTTTTDGDEQDPVARAAAAIPTGLSKQRALELETAVKAVLGGKEGASFGRAALEKELGLKLDDARLFGNSPPSLRAIAAAGKDGFKLRDRALHVYGEAARVREFAAVARSLSSGGAASAAPSPSPAPPPPMVPSPSAGAAAASSPSSPPRPPSDAAALARLGSLMDASHLSCAKLYDCSAPELDEFCAAAKKAGALGARLTGAGWGGCAVALVREADCESFLQAMRAAFYDKRVSKGVVKKEELGRYLFASRPAAGAAVVRLPVAAAAVAAVPAASGGQEGAAAASSASPAGGLAGSLRGLSLRRSAAGAAAAADA
jgi:galactokinase